MKCLRVGDNIEKHLKINCDDKALVFFSRNNKVFGKSTNGHIVFERIKREFLTFNILAQSHDSGSLDKSFNSESVKKTCLQYGTRRNF